MMLGFLLARAGVEVHIFEKHADFLRDFRGDTIHPSTLEIMHELGLLDDFLKLPHQEVRHLSAQIGDAHLQIADFDHLPTHCKFLAFMPQWDFLDFLADRAKAFPDFHLHMQAEVTGLVEEQGEVRGLRAKTKDGTLEVRADLVVGCDGRHSLIRDRAGFKSTDLGAPMDVLWFRLPRDKSDERETFGHAEAGHMFIMLDRGDYWQCAFVIPKGGFDTLKKRGLDAFRDDLVSLSPFLKGRTDRLASWDDVKLLTVTVDRLEKWARPGLLCIGDAAHAMSPIGGVGINLAVQDAVAAANILAEPLREGRCTLHVLEKVAKRRKFPTRVTQRLQLTIQDRLIKNLLTRSEPIEAPAILRWLARIPFAGAIPAYIIGIGARPEHVGTPDRTRSPS